MLSNVVSDIVCNTYTSQFRDRTMRFAMIVRFRVHVVGAPVNQYHSRELAIYSPTSHGYVSVLVRNIFNRELGPWTLLACHDSCWREDGVRRWFQENSTIISYVDDLGGKNWFAGCAPDEDMLTAIKERRYPWK